MRSSASDSATAGTADIDTAALRALVMGLSRVAGADDAERVDLLRVLEELKCAAAGAQARVTVELAASQTAAQVAVQQAAQTAAQRSGQQAALQPGVSARRLRAGTAAGVGIAAQVALARRESPHRGAQHLGLAHALTEMPHTAHALTTGQISEWRATILARETACLTRVDRAAVDAEVAALPGGLASLGDRSTQAAARRVAYRLDPHAFTRRATRAESERTVTVRPAPDTMTYVTGLLPVRQGITVYAALTAHAESLRATGDTRTRGQIMADTLVERVTGHTTTTAAPTAVPIEVHLVMTDTTLLHGDPTPAHLHGHGPIPAPLARHWLTTTTNSPDADAGPGLDAETQVFLRRLYTSPDHTTLVAMDTTRRHFTGGLRRLITLRDQHCRTPWCDAPIRHLDHPHRHTDGGPTSHTNSQGLCEACNHTKEAPGWTATPTSNSNGEHLIETTTPTGHHYTSRPPPPITARPTTPPAEPPADAPAGWPDALAHLTSHTTAPAPPTRARIDLHYSHVTLIA